KDLKFDEKKKKIEDKIFPQMKELLLDRIERLPMDEDKRQIMLLKVKGITFSNKDCALETAEEESRTLTELVIPNAYYDPDSKEFRICRGMMFSSDSEFDLAFAIGHEMAHAIDPCGIATGPRDLIVDYPDRTSISAMEQDYPLPDLLSCLISS